MKDSVRQICRLLFILGMPLIIGCGVICGTSTATVSELGLTMELPRGWKAERGNMRMMVNRRHPENWFGVIEDYPAEGKGLKMHVEDITIMDPASVRSRQYKMIGGCPAVELVSEAEYALIEVIIQKDDRIIRVSFRVEKEAFAAQKPALQRSFASIRFL
ncbi:MAG: hypothetical protein PHW60_11350 [Kiritimatiellae bacterium]|nr:hypothetical protein [Kiritimatiellia bacterium]